MSTPNPCVNSTWMNMKGTVFSAIMSLFFFATVRNLGIWSLGIGVVGVLGEFIRNFTRGLWSEEIEDGLGTKFLHDVSWFIVYNVLILGYISGTSDPGTNIQPWSVNVSEDISRQTSAYHVTSRFVFSLIFVLLPQNSDSRFFFNSKMTGHQGLGFGENLGPPGEESTHRSLKCSGTAPAKPTVHSWQHRLWPGKVPMDGPYFLKTPYRLRIHAKWWRWHCLLEIMSDSNWWFGVEESVEMSFGYFDPGSDLPWVLGQTSSTLVDYFAWGECPQLLRRNVLLARNAWFVWVQSFGMSLSFLRNSSWVITCLRLRVFVA